MSKHTPGPWKADGTVAYGYDIHTADGRIWVAEVKGGHGGQEWLPTDEEAAANAQLIAAAPEMYQALALVLDVLGITSEDCIVLGPGVVSEIKARIGAALAKVRGADGRS